MFAELNAPSEDRADSARAIGGVGGGGGGTMPIWDDGPGKGHRAAATPPYRSNAGGLMKLNVGTVIVVDDDASVRAALRRLLHAAGHTVRTYARAMRVSQAGRPPGPCCLILDLQLPGDTGPALKASLERAGVRVPTIFVTACAGDVAAAVRAMKSGAFDLLTKPFDARLLLRAVDAALDEDARTLEVERRMAELRNRFETLTARERDVFFAVTRGLLNKQVAAELGVSEKTVKVHRGRVTEKLAADSVAALVRMADRLYDAPVAVAPPQRAFAPSRHAELAFA
jgi:FixJ family two-component response regulator